MTDDELEAMLKQLSDKVFASIPTTVYVYPPAIDQEVMREAAASPEALDLVPALRMMQAIAKERAAVVSWLRQLAESCDTEAGTQSLLEAAGDIERGEHREGEP